MTKIQHTSNIIRKYQFASMGNTGNTGVVIKPRMTNKAKEIIPPFLNAEILLLYNDSCCIKICWRVPPSTFLGAFLCALIKHKLLDIPTTSARITKTTHVVKKTRD